MGVGSSLKNVELLQVKVLKMAHSKIHEYSLKLFKTQAPTREIQKKYHLHKERNKKKTTLSSTMSLNMNIELKQYLTFSKLLQKHLN